MYMGPAPSVPFGSAPLDTTQTSAHREASKLLSSSKVQIEIEPPYPAWPGTQQSAPDHRTHVTPHLTNLLRLFALISRLQA